MLMVTVIQMMVGQGGGIRSTYRYRDCQGGLIDLTTGSQERMLLYLRFCAFQIEAVPISHHLRSPSKLELSNNPTS